MNKPKSLFTKPLQALAHWMAYQKVLFPFYHIPELALISELARLITNFSSTNYKVYVEHAYKKICKDISGNLRADIYLKAKNNEAQNIVIEVKRYLPNQIGKDIKKLGNLKCDSLLKYLIVCSEKEFPSDFVNKNLNARKKLHKNYIGCTVKRVLKALPSLKAKNSYYVILIEVN